MTGRFELDYSPEDMGEVIERIRVQTCRQSIEGFANRLGFNAKIIENACEGKGAHINKVFRKCIELGFIKDVKLTVTFV
jgi:hypothetical protein